MILAMLDRQSYNDASRSMSGDEPNTREQPVRFCHRSMPLPSQKHISHIFQDLSLCIAFSRFRKDTERARQVIAGLSMGALASRRLPRQRLLDAHHSLWCRDHYFCTSRNE